MQIAQNQSSKNNYTCLPVSSNSVTNTTGYVGSTSYMSSIVAANDVNNDTVYDASSYNSTDSVGYENGYYSRVNQMASHHNHQQQQSNLPHLPPQSSMIPQQQQQYYSNYARYINIILRSLNYIILE